MINLGTLFSWVTLVCVWQKRANVKRYFDNIIYDRNSVWVIHKNSALKHKFENFLLDKTSKLEKNPQLDIIQVGQNLASSKYIQAKKQVGQRLGIKVNLYQYQETASPSELEKVLENLSSSSYGLIIQLPVPKEFGPFVNSIPPKIDVDLLGLEADQLWQRGFLPPTIGAIDLTLKDIFQKKIPERLVGLNKELGQNYLDYQLDFSGMVIAVIGRGKLVGSAANKYFLDREATLISIDINTPNPQKLTKEADIVISAAGQKNLIDSAWIKDGSILIDASTSESSGQLVGDTNQNRLPANIILSPSPGGIGGLTVLYLFYNLLKLSSS